MSAGHEFVDAPADVSEVEHAHRPRRGSGRPATGTLTIQRLADPLVETTGHPVASRYCELFWLPTIGPTALWLLRHGVMHTESGPYVVDASVLAQSIGINGFSLRKTLERLAGFNCAKPMSDTSWLFRTHLSQLAHRNLIRLPDVLQREHREWVTR